MRLDDMTVSVRQRFAAPPEQVFALLTDVERLAGLGPEHVRARWESPERAVGARFVGTNVRPDVGEWDVRCVVTAWEPGRRFAWTTGNPQRPSASWEYLLEPDGEGTVVRQEFRHGPGWTYLRTAVDRRPENEERYVEGRAAELARNMQAVLAAAAELV